MIPIRVFAPHVHAVLLMPQNHQEIASGVSALAKAGVDDIWLIAGNLENTIAALTAIRMAIHSPQSGVLGIPKPLDPSIIKDIASRCNYWRFWTKTRDKEPSADVIGMTWFASMETGECEPNVACYGDPLGLEPGPELNGVMFTHKAAQAALCGHIIPEVVRKHRHAFGFYVISPFAGKDPARWSLHADPGLIREVCDEAMILKEELAEGMNVIR